jgi:hypothetical protein
MEYKIFTEHNLSRITNKDKSGRKPNKGKTPNETGFCTEEQT